ncbi:MAG: bifunctional DNA-formamidopyrimidine glycosylase/DNA-(apurinic or apyrimidinic site) lyase, partial [Gammaproteobacteria bacterium]|nr:bifunctional DNA-formamidopyrimidine glycosylase/DNA-(apurinic or apyrimidinic site) lyase [Gammaproteobacteria bacterium]
ATVTRVIVRDRRLRWPVPKGFETNLTGCTIDQVERRAKYLLLRSSRGSAILHLGMSGSLRFVDHNIDAKKHDHVDIETNNGDILRFNDPRRFGCMLWTHDNPLNHPLLTKLGPEPLGDEFTGKYLHQRAAGRQVAIKQFIMNAEIVVGVGNIYASESLFRAGIHPKRAAGRISLTRMESLARAIKDVLAESIEYGGTTLRDFYNGEGKPGYFRNELRVYDRAGEPCTLCGKPLAHAVQGQRATYYCSQCQK